MSQDDDPDAGEAERERRGQGTKRQPTKRQGTKQRRRSRKARIFGWIAVLVTIGVTGTSLVAYAAYLNTVHSIETFSTSTTLGNNRPPSYNSSENILVVGSDSRAGSNRKFGANIQGQRSDTMLILHIRPNHRGAVVISLPRDTMVPVLACKADGLGDAGQPAQPGATEMLNATFDHGGPPCLWQTVEHETRIRIEHYVGLTFTGFEQVINDIGGVSVCLPIAIKDPKSGINLTAGKHHVGGQQALAFWRERYVGLGSDLQRIERQQYLMAGLIQEVKTGQLLSNYGKMYSVLRDTAKALTTDQGLSVSDMVSLAEDLRTLTTTSVQFLTAPNVPDPADNNRVIWQQPQASHLFYSIAHDTALPKAPKSKPSSSTQTTSPGHVQVDVENGSGVSGVATQAASELTSRGFKVTAKGNAANFNYTSNYIEYATPSDLAAANTLKAQLTGARVRRDPNLRPGTVYLILGSSFNGLSSSPAGSKGHSSPGPQNLNQTYGGINASANICKDSGAFAGPDNPANGT